MDIIRAIDKAIVKAAFDMEAHAVRVVPVDTGRLRASIYVKTKKIPGGRKVTLGAGTEYAQYVEFGTYKMRAQPYIRPAINAGINRYLPKRIVKELRAAK